MIEAIALVIREEMTPLYLELDGETYDTGDLCLVKIDGCREIGRVIRPHMEIEPQQWDDTGAKLLRKINDQDCEVLIKNGEMADKARKTCLDKLAAHNLEMKLIMAQYTYDRSKVRFFFTAEGRVDFRELVKDLAATLRTRIEMRQVGARDEARLLGGFGTCGQELCCTRFLGKFEPVTIKMAKQQSLALNPNKISGMCGRLMCCLSYEVETYINARKEAPRKGAKVKIPEGEAVVTGFNVIKETLTVDCDGVIYEVPLSDIKPERN
jgi:cell fate regulator YaaT (PSP1 superfamily)